MTEIVVITKVELEALIRKTITEVLQATPNTNFKDIEGDKFNQKQAAQYLGISQSTLIAWKKKGAVPYEQLPGSSKIFYYKSQLKAVIQQNPKLLQAARK